MGKNREHKDVSCKYCLEDGVERPSSIRSREMCDKHYQRFRKHGDPKKVLLKMEHHGMRNTYTYDSYRGMKARCTNPNNNHYYMYGAVGIKVCKRWMDSFQAFYDDMGERPKGYTIDRIDVKGGYTPENCRWADIYTQARNKGLKKSNKTGVIGVHFHKATGKYAAVIGKDHLGIFETIEQAAQKRKEEEIKRNWYGYKK